MPNPQNVFVNDVEWFEDSDYEYEGDRIIFTNVPVGTTTVEVYFKPKIPPIAKFTMIGKDSQDTFVENKITYGILNKEILFNAGTSSDDQEVVKYEWDFGDESTDSGKETSHTFTAPGKYSVNLTVTDDLDLKGYIEKSITIVEDKADLDADAMPDYWEGQYGLDQTTNDANNDSDGDGLTNLQEFENGTRPNREDTDNDNYLDDPKDKNSIPKVGKADGDDELDLLTILMLVAVIIIILIIIMLLLLIKKRRKREEEEEEMEEGYEGFGAVEEGEGEEMEGEMVPPPVPEELEEPGAGEAQPSWGVEEGEEEEGPFMPEGGVELPLYSGLEEDISHDDLAMDLEGLDISPEEGLPGVEEGLPPEEEKVPDEEVPAEEEVPPEEEKMPGEELGLDDDLLGIGDEESLDEEKGGEEIGEPKVKEPKKIRAKPPMPRKLKMDKNKIKLKKRQIKGKKKVTEEEEKTETVEKETEVKEEKEISDDLEKEEPKKVEEEPEEPEFTVKDYVKGGAIHFRNGKYTEAIIEWQKALDLEPDHPEIVASIKEAMAKIKENQD
jgi:PKD repeat protein